MSFRIRSRTPSRTPSRASAMPVLFRPSLGGPRALLAGLLAAASSVVVAGPCDIYAAGGTPCVAAHSTTRALYKAFDGPLYQVRRGSDGKTTTIQPKSAGGVANAATQESFCDKTFCVITVIYDQSGKGNDLTQAPGGGIRGPLQEGDDYLASAVGAPVSLHGQTVYGVFIAPGTGYRVDNGKGVARDDAPQGIYAVLDGSHYNDQCCFDYGNAEANNMDTGNGHMEAIYFGSCKIWGRGTGGGPWVMADLENGLFSGRGPGLNTNPSISHRFLTAIVKGKPGTWAIKAGNAAGGILSTYYDGARPTAPGYNPMHKEGSIILGIGGDNSRGAQGTFYEGCLTQGYPSDATEASVQADIVAAGYARSSMASGRSLKAGQAVTLRARTAGSSTRYIAHTGATVNTQVTTASNASAAQKAATWTVVEGLGNKACFSFESVDTPGSYIRHNNLVLQLQADDGSKQFHEDATFCPEAGFNGTGHAFRAWAHPTRYIRHSDNGNGGVVLGAAAPLHDDGTFEVGTSFA